MISLILSLFLSAHAADVTANRFILKDVANSVKIIPPSLSASYTLTMPSNDGGVNDCLKSDGAGILFFDTCASGTVSNITAGTGLNVGAGPGGSITTTGTLNLANTAVTPGIYGSATDVANFTVDQQGRITNATEVTIDLDAGQISSGVFPVARGGTGQSTLTANNVILGNGTSPVSFVAPGTSGNVLTSNGTTWTSAAAAAASPLTTKGDIYVYSTMNDRLPVGTNGQLLSADSTAATGLKWIAAPTTGATIALDNLASVAINTTLVSDTDNTDDLGSDSIEWKDAWAYAIKHNSAGTPTLSIATTGNNGNISLSPNGTGIVTSPKAIKSETSLILEDPGAGTNTTTIQSPTLSGNLTFTLPTSAGSSGQCLSTDGSGNFSWVNCGGNIAYFVGSLTYAGATNCTWTVTNTAFTNFGADTDCNTASVTGELSAPGTKIPGFTLTKKIGKYLIVPRLYGFNFTTGATISFRMSDGTDVSTEAPWQNRDSASGDFLSMTPMTFESTTTGSVTIQLQGRTSSGTISVNGNITTQNFGFDVYYFPSTASNSYPVISDASTERVERAKFTCSSSSSITSQSGSWISSIGNISSGACVVNFTASKFSSAPSCNVTRTDSSTSPLVATIHTAATTSAVTVRAFDSTTNSAATSYTFDLICMGPR